MNQMNGPRVMATILALAVVSALAGTASSAPAQQGSSATDRVPNMDLWQQYPRWLPPVFAGKLDEDGLPKETALAMAVQDDGTVHVLTMETQVDPQGFTRAQKVKYSNNKPETRGKNGFSENSTLLREIGGGESGVYPSDIAVRADGTITAAYRVFQVITQFNPNNTDVSTLYVKQFNPVTGQWGGEAAMGTGSYSEGTTSTGEKRTKYGPASLRYDTAGKLHMVYMEAKREKAPLGTPFPANDVVNETKLLYRLDLGATATVDSGAMAIVNGIQTIGTNLIYPQNKIGRRQAPAVTAIVTSGQSKARAVWGKNAGSDTIQLKYGEQDGGWGGATFSNYRDGGFDVAAGSDGSTHIVYFGAPDIGAPGSNLIYRMKSSTGGMGGEERIPSTASPDCRIGVDGRNQPVVVFSDPAGGSSGEGLATKVNNPAVTEPNKWVTQHPAVLRGGETMNMAITPGNEFVHVLGAAGHYTRTTEFNLGAQDPFTESALSRGAFANLATGNLQFELPLFAARGAGFSIVFSLRYNSFDGTRGSISQGWSHSYDMWLVENGNSSQGYTIQFSDGRTVAFTHLVDSSVPMSDWKFIAESDFGEFSSVQKNQPLPGQYQLTTKVGVKYTFNDQGRLTNIKDTNSNEIKFTYNPSRLTQIEDSMGRTTALAYDDKNRLSTVTDPASQTYTLTYHNPSASGELGKLHSVSFDGAPAQSPVEWLFNYHSENNPSATPAAAHNHLLSQVITPGGGLIRFGYRADGRISACLEPAADALIDEDNPTATTVSGVQPQRSITYFDPAPPFDAPGPAGVGNNFPRAEIRNARGFTTKLWYQSKRCLANMVEDSRGNAIKRHFDTEEITDDTGNPLTVPKHRNLVKFTDKKGVAIDYEYYPASESKPDFVADNLKNITPKQGATPASATPLSPVHFTYTADELNRVKTATNPGGKTTSYIRDSGTGNIRKIIQPETQLSNGFLDTGIESLEYDSRGRVIEYRDPNNHMTKFSYLDPDTGLATHILHPLATAPETFVYDRMGNVRFHQRPGGGTTELIYDGISRLSEWREPSTTAGQKIIVMGYDADSNVTEVRTLSGANQTVESVQYDSLNRVVRTVNPLGATKEVVYDREGNVRRVIDPVGSVTNTIYDELGREKLEMRDASGSSGNSSMATTYQYDENGNVIRRTLLGDGVIPDRTTQYFYDVRNNLRQTIHADGTSAEAFSYDANNNQTVSSRGQLVAGVFQVRTQSVAEYDERNRVRASTQVNVATGQSLTTAYLYDSAGNRIAIVDPSGRQTSFAYNERNKLVEVRDHVGTVVEQYVYDDRDLRIASKSQDSGTGELRITQTSTYNEKGELVSQADPYGAQPRFAYDTRGNLISSTDAAGFVTQYEYDSLDQRILQRSAVGTPEQTETHFAFDANGNRTLVRVYNPETGAVNADYVFTYDKANRLVQVTYPSLATGGSPVTERWSYNALGLLSSYTDQNGKVQSLAYDSLGRLTDEVHTSSQNVVLASIHRTYDGSSNLTSIEDTVSGFGIFYEKDDGSSGYDSLNRLTHVRWVLGGNVFKKLQYAYDSSSNRTQTADVSDGVSISYGYDSNNRLTSVSRTQSGHHISIQYDLGGRTKSVVLGASAPGALDGPMRIDYQYDAKGRTQEVKTSHGGITKSHFAYSYDERDNRKRENLIHMGVVVDYSYDPLSRLTVEAWTSVNLAPGAALPIQNLFAVVEGGNESGNPALSTGGSSGPVTVGLQAPPAQLQAVYSAEYVYDHASNRIKKTVRGTTVVSTRYAYDAHNRLAREMVDNQLPVEFGYDLNGNRTSRSQGSKMETYGYDHANRLVSYVRKDGASLEASFVYLYMPTGQRISKQNVGVNPIRAEWFAYDGENILQDYEQEGSGPLLKKRYYIQGLDLDSKFAMLDLDGSGSAVATHWFAPDALGSVHQLLNELGAVEAMRLQTPWGEPLPDVSFSFGGTASTRYGLTQRERDEESSLMHYRARTYDPRVGRFLQMDPLRSAYPRSYAYVSNMPTGRRDPTGEQDQDPNDPSKKTFWKELVLDSAKEMAKEFDKWVKPVLQSKVKEVAGWELKVVREVEFAGTGRSFVYGFVQGGERVAEIVFQPENIKGEELQLYRKVRFDAKDAKPDESYKMSKTQGALFTGLAGIIDVFFAIKESKDPANQAAILISYRQYWGSPTPLEAKIHLTDFTVKLTALTQNNASTGMMFMLSTYIDRGITDRIWRDSTKAERAQLSSMLSAAIRTLNAAAKKD